MPVDGASVGLLVADSFLVHDGRVVAPARHRERFLRDADAQGIVHPPRAFLEFAWSSLPRAGSWFPRIDMTERGELELWVRPAPALTRTVSVWTTTSDPRTSPGIKGPDIPALGNLRDQAIAAHATEAVMVSASGEVLDGATTCLMWWRDGVLCVQPPGMERVDSVTIRVVRDMATEEGVTVRETTAVLAEIAPGETWAVNALHGIRGVSAWMPDQGAASIDDDRLDAWRRRYAERFEEL